MSLYVLAGPMINHLSRATLAPQWAPADDVLFPGTNAFDGRADIPAFWSSSTSDPTMTMDLSLIPDGGFETSATGWTASSTDAVIASSSGQAHGGSYAGLLTATDSSGHAYADIPAVSGEALNFSWSLYATTTSCAASISLQNLQTGNYLSSGSTWGAAVTVASWATASWSSGSVSLTVEPTASSLVDTATLRVTLAASTGGSVYFDDIALIPAVNFCSIHGHNFTAAVTPLLQNHPEPGHWTTQSTMTIAPDSFYTVLSSGVIARYWRLKLSGTPAATPYVGEVILGNATALAERPLYGGQLEETEAQVRMTTADGGVWVLNRGASALRRLAFEFTYASSSGYEEARDAFFRGARGGLHPCVVAPADMDSDLVIFGTLIERATWTRQAGVVRSGGWDVMELPLPNVDYEP